MLVRNKIYEIFTGLILYSRSLIINIKNQHQMCVYKSILRKVRIDTIPDCPAQSRVSHFVAQSKKSYLAQDNFRIVSVQCKNRDNVRIIQYVDRLLNMSRSAYSHQSPALLRSLIRVFVVR